MPAMTCALVERLQTIPDPRSPSAKRKYPLVDLIILGRCGVVARYEDGGESAKGGKCTNPFCGPFWSYPRAVCLRIPAPTSLPCSHRRRCRQCCCRGCGNCGRGPGDYVHLEGTPLRRTRCQQRKLKALHVVSAWAGQSGITFGQVAVADKANEITAMPELLKLLDLHETIVTIDALGVSRPSPRRSWGGPTSWRSRTIRRSDLRRFKTPLRRPPPPSCGPPGSRPLATRDTDATNSVRSGCCPRGNICPLLRARCGWGCSR